MVKNNGYLRKTVAGLLIFLFIAGGIFGFYHYKKEKESIYDKNFKTLVVIVSIGGRTLASPCQPVSASLKVTEKAVTLTFNGDILSGVPLGVTPDGGLQVQFSNNILVIIYKADPDNNGTELLMLVGPGETLLLSQDSNCEDITALMDQGKKEL